MKETSHKVARKRAKNIKKIKLSKERDVFMKLGGKIRAYLFTGILVTAPVGLTFYMVYKFVLFVDRNVNILIPRNFMDKYFPFTIPGLGLIVAVIGFILVGMFAAGFMGRFFIRLGEWIVFKMPVISSIYSLLKQIFETFLSNKKSSFNKVVLLEYPRRDMWIIGLVSGDTKGEIKSKIKKKTKEKELINVVVISTPNPTSGFLVFVPKKDIIELNMSVEDAFKFVISCGIVDPSEMGKEKKGK